jgi:hypothetical protein
MHHAPSKLKLLTYLSAVALLMLPCGHAQSLSTYRIAAASLAQEEQALTPQEELAVSALEGLLALPPERALALLKKTLAGQHTVRIKTRALFVLGQMDSAEAGAIVLQYAQNAGPLQHEAVRQLAIRGDAQTLQQLQQIYPKANAQIQESIIEAMMIADSADGLLALAKLTPRNSPQLSHIIQMLAVSGGRDQLRELAKLGIAQGDLLDAYAMAGDLDALKILAQTGASSKLKSQAVQAMAIVGVNGDKALRERTSKELVNFYQSSDPKVREAVLEAMMIMQDDTGLLALYRSAKTVDEKKQILQMLSMTGSDAALEAIDAALQGKQP